MRSRPRSACRPIHRADLVRVHATRPWSRRACLARARPHNAALSLKLEPRGSIGGLGTVRRETRAQSAPCICELGASSNRWRQPICISHSRRRRITPLPRHGAFVRTKVARPAGCRIHALHAGLPLDLRHEVGAPFRDGLLRSTLASTVDSCRSAALSIFGTTTPSRPLRTCALDRVAIRWTAR